MAHRETGFLKRGGRREALLAGGCFALAALLVSASVILSLGNDSWQVLIYASTVAAFVTGALLWRVLFARGRRPTLWRGVLAGALVGIASHPLA